MAASKVFASFFLVMCSMIYVGFGQQNGGGGGAPAPGTSLPCLQQLLPCQPYLKPPSNPPPACCVPMNGLVRNQPQCLCQIFNNADLLKSLNITQADALKLANTCHANADASMCKKVTASPSGSPATPSTPSASNSSSPNSPPSAAGVVGAHLGLSAAIALFLFLVLSNMGFV